MVKTHPNRNCNPHPHPRPHPITATTTTTATTTSQDCVDYLTWTYFFRRLIANPSYYHLEDTSTEGVQEYLQALAESVLADLEAAGTCIMSDQV